MHIKYIRYIHAKELCPTTVTRIEMKRTGITFRVGNGIKRLETDARSQLGKGDHRQTY